MHDQVSYRSLILVTLPAMFAVVLEPMAEMIDTAVLGHESTLWVAALAATNACLGTFAWVFNFLSYGVTAQIAQSYGANRTEEIGAHVRTALFLAFFIGCTVGTVLFYIGDWFLLDVMGTEGELYSTSLSYYSIRVLGYPFTILSITLIGILRGLQAIRYSGIVVLIMTATNGIGTYLSVFHFGLGIEGAAWATVASFILGNLLVIAWLVYYRNSIGLDRGWRVVWSDITDIGTDGLNLAGRTGLLTSAYLLVTASATRLGVSVVAAHQVALQLWLLAAFLIDGLGITATAIGGQLVGSGHREAHKLLVQRLLILGVVLGTAFFIFYLLAKQWLIGLYTDQTVLMALVGTIWLPLALSQPFNAFTYVLDGILFGNREFAFLRRRMLEGFIFCFLPLLALGYFYLESLMGLWLALLALNAYRGATSWVHVRKAW